MPSVIVYLDSFYLIELTKKPSHDITKFLSRLRYNTYHIIISQIVLGESIAVITKKNNDPSEIIRKLYSKMDKYGIGSDNMKPPPKEAFDIMTLLSSKTDLDPTDTMIVSHALADPNSKFFFTSDSKLIGNQVIEDIEKELRDNDKRSVEMIIQDSI